MTLSEFDTKRCEKLVARFIEKRRPPPHVRADVDLTFRISEQSVEIFEVRPDWRDKTRLREHPVAKATFNNNKRRGSMQIVMHNAVAQSFDLVL